MNMNNRLPNWLRKKSCGIGDIHRIKSSLRRKNLHTVCEEAKCPNLGECFARGTATIMIMGNVCTRKCRFCAVNNGMPKLLDENEPENVALQIKELNLKHVVITSVTRDDLFDGGAKHFAKTVGAIRKTDKDITVEVLTPDFGGKESEIKTVCESSPEIFNHNIETVERLTPEVRNKADYQRSLQVLTIAKRYLPKGKTKSGFMVGLGESFSEVEKTLQDLKKHGCDVVTIGQYLRPSKNAIEVKEYVRPEVFIEYENVAKQIGFEFVFAGPFVRSSYLADRVL